ncbi:MAG: VWA domain-containing protein [Deltaproteobacteria bacterium]|nr:VWA domain-containing protein [Deltaproteobacteria bacterium]
MPSTDSSVMTTSLRRNCLALIAAVFIVQVSPLTLADQETQVQPALVEKSNPRARFYKAAIQSVPQQGDKTLSPYFFVFSDDPETDRLPLKSTRADIQIAGVIANVKVTQVYKNEGDNILEAVYIFPSSTRAAVYAMRMTVGERIIEAQIMKREQARETYEKAKREGRTASLLEQQRPNVFQMNVANILPGDQIKVEFSFTELLVPEDNIYEFVYPTVVGPRYSTVVKDGAPETEKWVETPYLHGGQAAPYSFGLDIGLRSGVPVQGIVSPSHKIETEFISDGEVKVNLAEDNQAANRDFVLRYSFSGPQIASGMLLYPGQDENFFLLMMEPPERIRSGDIVPREYIFIVDVSGSMDGFPLDVSKQLMDDLLSGLNADEFFNVILFAGGSDVLARRSLLATRRNIRQGLRFVCESSGGGGTNLLPALRKALALRRREGTARIIVVITDGYVGVEKESFDVIRENMGKANLFAFGIGSSVNRFLIEGMARAGHGEPFIVLGGAEAEKQAARFKEYISAPLMQGISVEFEEFDAYDLEPIAVPDLFAQRPVVVFGKYRGQPRGSVVIRGHVPGQKLEGRQAVSEGIISEQNEALRYLWARQRIMRLADMNNLAPGSQNQPIIDQVTELGLKYNLMTKFTSFVAVDTEVRADGTKSTTVRQAVPMPKGVSDSALGSGEMLASCEFSSPYNSSGSFFSFEGGLRFAINLDVFTLTGSTDGGNINHFAEIDFLLMWPLFKYWNPYYGLGMGVFAPRVRFGFDVFFAGRDESGLMLKLGGRYILTTWVADQPDSYENFDAKDDYAHGFMGEIGVGWRFGGHDLGIQLLAMYLVGPMWPQKGAQGRSFGDVSPSGTAVFHGGTLSLALDW